MRRVTYFFPPHRGEVARSAEGGCFSDLASSERPPYPGFAGTSPRRGGKRSIAAFALAAALAGCAPTLQQQARPGAAFAGPRLEDHAFVSFDGVRLGLTRWDARGGPPKAVIIGLHGMNDYANAFHLAAADWAGEGITTLAYDQRGFGRSPGRGVWAPDALLTEDLRTIVALARRRYPGAIIAVAGESMGGAVAIEAFASDRPPAADRLILLSPAVWGWSSQPVTYKTALWLADHLAPGWVINPPSWVTNHIYASDNLPEMIAMSRDPLMEWGVRADALYGLVQTMQKASAETGDLRAPTLYMYGAHDEIIPPNAAFAAVARLPANARTAYYARGWHLLMRDYQAANVWADAAAFVFDPAAPLPSEAPPIPRPPGRAEPQTRSAGVVTRAPGA